MHIQDDPDSDGQTSSEGWLVRLFTSKGWEPKTNFVLDSKADLISKEYNMKGNISEIKLVSGEKVDIYIPEVFQ